MPQKRFDALIYALLPIAFIGSGFLNMVTYPFGIHQYDTLRKVITFGIIVVTALLLLVKVALVWKERPEQRRFLFWCACIPVLLGILYLVGFLTQPAKSAIFKSAVIAECYLVSAVCAFAVVLSEKSVRRFLKSCRIYGWVAAPIMLYYCLRFYFPVLGHADRNLGALIYMPLAYTLLEFCLLLLAEILLFGTESGKEYSLFWTNLSLIVLFSAAITLSNTKGAILCLLDGMVLCFPALLLTHSSRRFYLLPVSSVLSIVLFCSVLFPGPASNNRILRFFREMSSPVQSAEQVPSGSVSQESAHNAAVTTDDFRQATEILRAVDPEFPDGVLDYDTAYHRIDVAYDCGLTDEWLEAGLITESEYAVFERVATLIHSTSTGDRKYLWTMAVDEMLSAPLTGHGPLAFQSQYGTYPHNLFLEIGADFGSVTLFAILALGLYVFFCLIRLSLQSRAYLAWTLYVLAQLPSMMVSGSLYTEQVFFQYGFCILFVFLYGRKTLAGKQPPAER